MGRRCVASCSCHLWKLTVLGENFADNYTFPRLILLQQFTLTVMQKTQTVMLHGWCQRVFFSAGTTVWAITPGRKNTVFLTCVMQPLLSVNVFWHQTSCLLHCLPVLQLMGQIMYQMASHNRDSLTQSRVLCRGVVTESGNIPLHLNNFYLWEPHRSVTWLPARVGPGDEMLSYRKHVKLRELELSWSNSPFTLSMLRGWPAQ